jgi:hypothetical protein
MRVVLLLLLLLSLPLAGVAQQYERIAASVSERRVAEGIEALYAMPRVGTPGSEALRFLTSDRALGALGDATIETYRLPLPSPQARGELRAGDTAVPLYPLWPNGVRTSSCRVRGPLVYGGSGSLTELSGKRIEGAVVALDFNSGSNWRNAAALGAAAILFLEPSDTTRREADKKWSSMPLDVPRFYVRGQNAATVLESAGRDVEVRCDQPWVAEEAVNLFVAIRGADARLRNEWVAFAAYSDTVSVVPGLPHGADQTAGLAALLELARYFKANPPKRSVLLLVTSGHFQGMAGVREFMEARFRDGWAITGGRAPVCFFTLDISGGWGALAAHAQGWWLRYRMENFERERGIVRALRDRTEGIARTFGKEVQQLLVDAVNNPDGREWRNRIPVPFAAECEVVNMTGLDSVTFLTAEDARLLQDTPFDTPSRINLQNVVQQIRTLVCLAHHIANDPSDTSLGMERSIPYNVRPAMKRMSLMGGFSTIKGQVVEFDPSRNFYPDVPVPGALVLTTRDKKSLGGVRGLMMTMSDGSGRYELHGAPPVTLWDERDRYPLPIYAFAFDKGGAILRANDMGVQGGQFDTYFRLTTAERNTPIVVFRGAPLQVLQTVDPLSFRALPIPTVLDAHSDGEPRRYSIFFPPENPFTVAGIGEAEEAFSMFVDPHEPVKVLARGWDGALRMALLNAHPDAPTGAGITPSGGAQADVSRQGTLLYSTLCAAQDMVRLNRWRLDLLEAHRVTSPTLRDLQAKSESALSASQEAYAREDYAEGERQARAAWGYALRLHPILLATARDALYGLLVYLALLVPFSYVLERLLFGMRTLAMQIVAGACIFGAVFVLLRFLHPAFEIAQSTLVIFVAFVMGMLSVIVITFLLSKFETSLQHLADRAHEVATRGATTEQQQRLSLFITAVGVGIGSMRRRPVRTLLTCVTLLAVMVIVLSFTSIVPALRFNALPSDGAPRYAGILFRTPQYDPLEENSVHEIEIEFPNATVVRRVWFHGAQPGAPAAIPIESANGTANLKALLGLDPEEHRVMRLDQDVVLAGRWFRPDERYVALLPQSVARELGVGVGATVRVAGAELSVIGVLADRALQEAFDLDGEPLLPADFAQSDLVSKRGEAGSREFRRFVRMDPEVTAIVPAETLLAMGGRVRSVAVAFSSFDEVERRLGELLPRTDLNLYASVKTDPAPEIRRFSAMAGTSATGIELILIPVLIAVATIVNTMVAGVLERRKEIAILSAIGLSPRQVASLFLLESLVYAILAAVGGYICAQLLVQLLDATGLMTGVRVNYSSLSALFATGVVAVVVLLSALYPSMVAKRIATPGEGAQWRLAVPEGNSITNPLPFTVTDSQASRLVEHYGGWLASYREYGIGDISVEVVEAANSDEPRLSGVLWLAPYDLGVRQRVELLFPKTETDGIRSVVVEIERLSGDPSHWVTANRRFLEAIRKQFLLWRQVGRVGQGGLNESDPLEPEGAS